jgi:hypothetical protein
LVQRLLWPQDEIEEQPGNKKQDDKKCRKNLRKDASAPGLNIAKCPGNERKPNSDEVRDPDRKQELDATCGSFDHEPFPLGEPLTASLTASLSVPDTLELPDRKDKHAGTTRALLCRTRDPEFRLPGERP